MRLFALAAVGLAGLAVTTLPRPPFPGPVANAPAPTHLRVISSRYLAPGAFCTTHFVSADHFRGVPALRAIPPTFILYGKDGASARYLLSFDESDHLRYGFDFKNYLRPPRVQRGEVGFVSEQIVWAHESKHVLFVQNAHSTYARSSYNRNAYVTAIDLKTKRRLWRSSALVANACNFVVAGRYLVTGYGFTAEPDYLYLLVRKTGRVVERLKLPSAPERITRAGNRLTVRTYDHVVVVQLKGA